VVFTIELADGQEFSTDADAVTVDPAGSLRFTRGPATVLVVAARVWRCVYADGVKRLPPPVPKSQKPSALPLQALGL
jgi:hypothetical protein